MAIELGGVVLNPGMVWSDRYSYSPVTQNVNRTLGGVIRVTSLQLKKGRPITLEAIQDQGWLTRTVVDQVKALADVAGATYSLTVGPESFIVMFRHEDGPAVEFLPLIPRGEPLDDDYFVGTLKLITV